MELTGRQRRYLRSLAHSLQPSVIVGKQGPSDHVIDQIEANLLAHELIKVKVLQTAPLEPDECGSLIAERTGAALAQRIGRTLVLYRPKPETPEIMLPSGRNE